MELLSDAAMLPTDFYIKTMIPLYIVFFATYKKP